MRLNRAKLEYHISDACKQFIEDAQDYELIACETLYYIHAEVLDIYLYKRYYGDQDQNKIL